VKIEKIIHLDDGQKIYIMGQIYPFTFNQYLKDYKDWYHRDQQQQTHFAMRRYIQYRCRELSEWLEKYNCQTTNWVHPNIEAFSNSNVVNFDWGIGFRHNDPKETIFTLRWS
jgi:hypothetical protein